MKYEVGKTELNRAAAAAYKASYAGIPGCAVVQIEAGKDAVELRSTDLKVFRSEKVLAHRIEGRGNAAAVVTARSLRDVVRAQPGKTLALEITDDGLRVGGVPVEPSTVPPEDIPVWPAAVEDGAAVPFQWEALRDAVVKVAAAVSTEEHRFTFQLLHVAAVGREVELAGTDGHRLHVARCATRAEMTEDAEDLVPLAVAQELKSSVALRAIGGELRPVLRVGLPKAIQMISVFSSVNAPSVTSQILSAMALASS